MSDEQKVYDILYKVKETEYEIPLRRLIKYLYNDISGDINTIEVIRRKIVDDLRNIVDFSLFSRDSCNLRCYLQYATIFLNMIDDGIIIDDNKKSEYFSNLYVFGRLYDIFDDNNLEYFREIGCFSLPSFNNRNILFLEQIFQSDLTKKDYNLYISVILYGYFYSKECTLTNNLLNVKKLLSAVLEYGENINVDIDSFNFFILANFENKSYFPSIELLIDDRFSYLNEKILEVESNDILIDKLYMIMLDTFDDNFFAYFDKNGIDVDKAYKYCLNCIFNSDTYTELQNKCIAISDMVRNITCFDWSILASLKGNDYKLVVKDKKIILDDNYQNKINIPRTMKQRSMLSFKLNFPSIDFQFPLDCCTDSTLIQFDEACIKKINNSKFYIKK